MKTLFPCAVLTLTLVAGSALVAADKNSEGKKVAPALNFTMKSLAGKDVELNKYQGKVVLVVNVASECGLTPQYEGLQKLHKQFSGEGLAVLGFPANEFGKQEPGTDEQIDKFCKTKYGVDFDMFSKVVVKGNGQCELYKFLTSKETDPKFAGDIKWNFEKFLIGRNGEVVARFAPKVDPTSEEVVNTIKAELSKK
jgi:glutathione peroxidase